MAYHRIFNRVCCTLIRDWTNDSTNIVHLPVQFDSNKPNPIRFKSTNPTRFKSIRLNSIQINPIQFDSFQSNWKRLLFINGCNKKREGKEEVQRLLERGNRTNESERDGKQRRAVSCGKSDRPCDVNAAVANKKRQSNSSPPARSHLKLDPSFLLQIIWSSYTLSMQDKELVHQMEGTLPSDEGIRATHTRLIRSLRRHKGISM